QRQLLSCCARASGLGTPPGPGTLRRSYRSRWRSRKGASWKRSGGTSGERTRS
ncbi:unnamed protein product, partial [Effrenium voratum]